MKLQLTKTKTIEIAGPGKGAPSDVVGIELTDDPRGCPAVRLQRRRGALRLVAAGFVPPPTGKLPSSWEELDSFACGWTLPSAFQAPTAAIAVDHAEAIARQTTIDSIRASFGESDKVTVETGKAFSHKGQRIFVSALADEGFVLEAGLPEYQVLWLGRLFPEGHRPTVASVQVSTLARVAALSTQPELEAGGSLMSMLVSEHAIHFAGWSGGRLALLRQCPAAGGWRPIREAVKVALSMDESLVDEVMDGNMVDPCFAMEPFVRPVLRELALSVDYMAHRMKVEPGWVFLTGLPSGGSYWNQIAARSSRLSFVVPNAFAGLEIVSKKVSGELITDAASQVFLAALGAARSLMEEVPS